MCFIVHYLHIGRFLKGLKKTYQDELAKASSTAEESFGNILTVRSFSNENKTIVSYSKDINSSYKLWQKVVCSDWCIYGSSHTSLICELKFIIVTSYCKSIEISMINWNQWPNHFNY